MCECKYIVDVEARDGACFVFDDSGIFSSMKGAREFVEEQGYERVSTFPDGAGSWRKKEEGEDWQGRDRYFDIRITPRPVDQQIWCPNCYWMKDTEEERTNMEI